MHNHRLVRSALSAMLLAVLSVPAAASSLPDYPFVHVTGSAFEAVMPDLATLDFEIVAVDADPAAARAVLDTRMGEIQALMQGLALDPEDAAAREVRQSVRKGETAPGGGPLYELRCDVHIKVRQVGNWPKLAAGLLGKPNLDGFATAFDIGNADQVGDELVTRAIMDARRRATVMAEAGGRRLGPMTAATPGELKNLSTAMGLAREDFRSGRSEPNGGARPIDPDALLSVQSLKLRQSVDVVFRLENAGRAAAGAKRPK